jgi:pimeloyl-ACP methyl ester carboxylesterase
MASFILVHGACHGGWCWERITPLLEAAGHRVVAPDLPGTNAPLGEGQTATLDLWARFIANLAEAEAAPVILVGHSRAGIVISRAAELAPDSIRLLVYVAAMLSPPGETLFSVAAMTDAPAMPIVLSPDQASLTVSPDTARAFLYNRTAEPWVSRAVERLVPEPALPGAMPLDLTPTRFGRVDRVYIGCTDDRTVFSAALRAWMLQRTPCGRVVELDADHSPFYSAPEALAAELLGLAPGKICVDACGDGFAARSQTDPARLPANGT